MVLDEADVSLAVAMAELKDHKDHNNVGLVRVLISFLSKDSINEKKNQS